MTLHLPLLELLAQTDGWAWLRVLAAAAFYASALVAVGGVWFGLVFGGNPALDRAAGLRTLVPAAAGLALALLLLQWPLQAGFLGGGTWAAAFDPGLLALVFDGAAGQRILLAGSGLLLLSGVRVVSARWRGLGDVYKRQDPLRDQPGHPAGARQIHGALARTGVRRACHGR